MFFHLLDLSLVNAWILHNVAAEKPLTHLDFRLAVANQLLEGHISRCLNVSQKQLHPVAACIVKYIELGVKKDHKLKYDVRYAKNAIQCKLSSVVYYNKEALLFEVSFEAVELD